MPVNFPTMAVLIRSTWRTTTLALAIAAAACGGSNEADAADATHSADSVAAANPAPALTTAPVTAVAPVTSLTTTADDLVVADAGTALVASTVFSEALAVRTLSPEYRYCATVPVAGVALGTAGVHSVREFGAIPDDNNDDTAAIQKGLDSLKAGETLKFERGRYLINRSLHVRTAGLKLDGQGLATLHATNPDDQSIMIEADNTTVASFTLTAVTQGRRSAPRHARIAVHAPVSGGYRVVHNTEIRNNRIVNAGEPGTPEANSASANGIILFRADGFLIADNTVARSLADAIHMTAGTRNGRVLNNTVREVGDDMIAMVSYAEGGTAALNNAAHLRDNWDSKVAERLVRNIVVAGNQLSGPYWGRGISVVGGESITISRNTLSNLPLAAGILVAREANYQTFGAQNILIEGNTLRDVQTGTPPYDPVGKFASSGRTGHGAIEVHAALFADEAADSMLRTALSIRNVVMVGNTVEHASVGAMRAGVNMSNTISATDASGTTVSRSIVNGLVQNVSSQGGRFSQVKNDALSVMGASLSSGIYCSDNRVDGAAYTTAACKVALAPVPSGSTQRCSIDGKLM